MKKLTRRNFLTRSIKYTAGMIAALFGGRYYIEEIEPHWIEYNHYTFAHPSVLKTIENLKIVQFSDTHIGFQFGLKELEKVVHSINSMNPDIICFTGDLLDNPNEYKVTPKLVETLSKLKASLGKYSIYGNHDHGGYGTDIYMDIMTNSGFKMLMNQSHTIRKNGCEIIISGIDDAMLGKPDLTAIQKKTQKNQFHLLLSHAPDYANQASSYQIDIQLSGHSHGGQVQFPFFGALITPPFAEKYVEGYYEVNEKLPLYVNRGLGTTRYPFRLFSRPEITIFELKHGDLQLEKKDTL